MSCVTGHWWVWSVPSAPRARLQLQPRMRLQRRHIGSRKTRYDLQQMRSLELSAAGTLSCQKRRIRGVCKGRRVICAPPVTSMGTPNAFMKRTASACPAMDRLKQPSRSDCSESAPARGKRAISAGVSSSPAQLTATVLSGGLSSRYNMRIRRHQCPDFTTAARPGPACREGACDTCTVNSQVEQGWRRDMPDAIAAESARHAASERGMASGADKTLQTATGWRLRAGRPRDAPHWRTTAPGWYVSMTLAMTGLNSSRNTASVVPAWHEQPDSLGDNRAR